MNNADAFYRFEIGLTGDDLQTLQDALEIHVLYGYAGYRIRKLFAPSV